MFVCHPWLKNIFVNISTLLEMFVHGWWYEYDISPATVCLCNCSCCSPFRSCSRAQNQSLTPVRQFEFEIGWIVDVLRVFRMKKKMVFEKCKRSTKEGCGGILHAMLSSELHPYHPLHCRGLMSRIVRYLSRSNGAKACHWKEHMHPTQGFKRIWILSIFAKNTGHCYNFDATCLLEIPIDTLNLFQMINVGGMLAINCQLWGVAG